MLVKANISALKRPGWLQYGLRFVLGGLITAAAGVIAKKFGPAIGGLFLAFPAIFPASATLIEKHERTRKHKKGMHGDKRGRDAASLDAGGAALGSVALMAFAVLIWLFIARYPTWLVLLGAGVTWIVVAVGVWKASRWWRHKAPMRSANNQGSKRHTARIS